MRNAERFTPVLSLLVFLGGLASAQQPVETLVERSPATMQAGVWNSDRSVNGTQTPLRSSHGSVSGSHGPCFIHVDLPHDKLYFHVARPDNMKSLSASLSITVTSSHRQRLVIRSKKPETDVASLGIVSSSIGPRGSLRESEKGTTISVRWFMKTQPEYPEWTSGEPIRLIRDGALFEGVSWLLGSSLPGESRCEIKCEIAPEKYQIDGRYSNDELVIDFVPIF